MRNLRYLLVLVIILLLFASISGVYGEWVYPYSPAPVSDNISPKIENFRYGLIYITSVKIIGGSYDTAVINKIADTNIGADIALNSSAQSSVTAEVTFYNSTAVSYYYDEALAISSSNLTVGFDVSGIMQEDEVPSKTYKTLTLTFSGNAGAASYQELNFKFTVDKNSIADIVAISAVDKFEDILNTQESYNTLVDAMDNRSGFNKASAVTYIGNVAGADSGDSATLNGLFGQEFMSMDLDGDGSPEPITIMIKREDLDSNATTGASYTYSTWTNTTTVNGVEMTLYITAADLSAASNGGEVVVYAAVFTKYSNADEWVEIVPLTKGTANANNYSGWGSANSFDTDTWVSDIGDTISTLVTRLN